MTTNYSLVRPWSNHARTIALVLVLAFGVTACGSDADDEQATSTMAPTSTTAPEPTVTPPPTTAADIGDASVVMVAELVGGCAMLGPNCPTYVVWDDGRAVLLRGEAPVDPFVNRLDDAAIEAVGFIDGDLAAEVRRVANTTDFAALIPTLGPGQCNACLDGVDSIITVSTPDGLVTLASAEVDFDASEPFFAAVAAAVGALGSELQLSIESR